MLVPTKSRALHATVEIIVLLQEVLLYADTHTLVGVKVGHHPLEHIFTTRLKKEFPNVKLAITLRVSQQRVHLIEVFIKRLPQPIIIQGLLLSLCNYFQVHRLVVHFFSIVGVRVLVELVVVEPRTHIGPQCLALRWLLTRNVNL